MKDKLIAGIKTYWFVALLGVCIVGMLFYTSSQSKKIDKLKTDVASVQDLVAEANTTYSRINVEFDAKKHQEQLKARTVSAEKIGKEIIAVDAELTAFYKTNAPLPKDEAEKKALMDRVDKAKAENSRLTNARAGDHIKTWRLNPAWTLTLDSVVVYQDADLVPIVFSMKTKDGKLAGLIVATYDVVNHKLLNINRHYTTDGLKDEVDVGGA